MLFFLVKHIFLVMNERYVRDEPFLQKNKKTLHRTSLKLGPNVYGVQAGCTLFLDLKVGCVHAETPCSLS